MYNEVRAKTISELKREMMHGLLKSKRYGWSNQHCWSCYGTSIQSFRANLVSSKEANKTRVRIKTRRLRIKSLLFSLPEQEDFDNQVLAKSKII
jgi:hypothetical protein